MKKNVCLFLLIFVLTTVGASALETPDDIRSPILSSPEGFYGIWVNAATDMEYAIIVAEELSEKGYSSVVVFTPEWENMNPDPYYCVSVGRFGTRKEAEQILDTVRKRIHPDAYIKYTGKRLYATLTYTNYGNTVTEITDSCVILRDVPFSESRFWYPERDAEEETLTADLVIDEKTVFDASCETAFFGNYRDGDTPLQWYLLNADLMENDPEAYIAYGPALSGVFEVSVTGSHIDRFFGSYWWD